MTIRQFAYLAGGCIIGYVVYKTLPLPALLKYPIVGVAALGGVALAFLPIQDRPLDRWIVAFIKSIFAPTQYFWEKQEIPPDILTRTVSTPTVVTPKQYIESHQDANNKLKSYLATLPVSAHQTISDHEHQYIERTLSLFQTGSNGPVIPTTFSSSSSATHNPSQQSVTVRSAVAAVHAPTISRVPSLSPTPSVIPQPKPDLESVPRPVSANPNAPAPETAAKPPVTVSVPPTPQPTEPPVKNQVNEDALQEQLKLMNAEKMKLAKELEQLKSQMGSFEKPTIVNPKLAEEASLPTIKSVSAKSAPTEIGMPNIPNIPNIVLGVVKDGQKRLLPNIILTIKDSKGMPVRALKTNKLGQFETATPLASGTYLLELEDPLKRFVFDIAQIVLTGKIFLPIEIIAKGQKEIVREQLTKEIFGSMAPIANQAAAV